MKIALIPSLLVCGLTMLLAGCEEVADPSDVPYVEKMVVTGTITVGSQNDTIRFSRTLPLNQLYSPTDAELTDVNATITTASTGQSFRLQHLGHGNYIAPGLTPVAGETYTLAATWHDHSVTAFTTAPEKPVIDTITVNSHIDENIRINGEPVLGYYLDVAVRPLENAACGLRYSINSGDSSIWIDHWTYSYEYDEVLLRHEDAGADGKLHLSPLSNPLYYEPPYTGTVWVFAYDRPYYDYFTTRYDNNDDDNPFSTPGEKVRWNVKGDGIGVFTSRNVATWTREID
jgi:hypothetical protein